MLDLNEIKNNKGTCYFIFERTVEVVWISIGLLLDYLEKRVRVYYESKDESIH